MIADRLSVKGQWSAVSGQRAESGEAGDQRSEVGRQKPETTKHNAPSTKHNAQRTTHQAQITTHQAQPKPLTLRTSWVYGDGTQNFFHKLKQWSRKQDVLKIVYDQISIPTYTDDIVTYTLKALDAGLHGTYHLTNSGYASRYEVARYFLDRVGIDKLVLPVPSSQFGSTVKRPFFSAMSNKRLSEALGTHIPTWQDAVRRYAVAQPGPG